MASRWIYECWSMLLIPSPGSNVWVQFNRRAVSGSRGGSTDFWITTAYWTGNTRQTLRQNTSSSRNGLRFLLPVISSSLSTLANSRDPPCRRVFSYKYNNARPPLEGGHSSFTRLNLVENSEAFSAPLGAGLLSRKSENVRFSDTLSAWAPLTQTTAYTIPTTTSSFRSNTARRS